MIWLFGIDYSRNKYNLNITYIYSVLIKLITGLNWQFGRVQLLHFISKTGVFRKRIQIEINTVYSL